MTIPAAKHIWALARGSIALCAILLAACNDDVRNNPYDTIHLFGPEIDEVIIEVDYQHGAEPYTRNINETGSPWVFFQHNAAALFTGSPRTIRLPLDISEMQSIGRADTRDFSIDHILALANSHRSTNSTSRTPSFYILFLNGYFFEDNTRHTGVLGVSIGGTGIIAMFKPVIRSTAPVLPNTSIDDLVRQFAEQTTLIHEFGHAIGLVANGLPLSSDHHDEENGRHCTNTRCVMYYRNEGVRDLISFIEDTNNCLDQANSPAEEDACLVLYDTDCLADAFLATAHHSAQ